MVKSLQKAEIKDVAPLQPNRKLKKEDKVIKENTDSVKSEIKENIKNEEHQKEGKVKPISEAKKEPTKKEVDISSDLDEGVQKKIPLTFGGKDIIKNEISKPKKETQRTSSNTIDINSTEPKSLMKKDETVAEIQEQIKKAEEETVNNMTPDDYEMIAEFLMDTVDWGGSSFLMWIAKDTKDSPYTLRKSKKDRLVTQLTRILIKTETKMNFTVLFIISFLLAYLPLIKESLRTRKAITKAEKREKLKQAEIERKRISDKEKEKPKEEVVPKRKQKPKESEKQKPKESEKQKPKENKDNSKKITEEVEELKDDIETKKDELGRVIVKRKKGNPSGGRRARKRLNKGE